MPKGIFSKCPLFYSKKTLRIKQNVWFWHTFQNKSVIYNLQFFFYCWTTAGENCFFWLDFIVFQAFVFLLYNYIHTGRTAGSLCDTKNIKTPKHWEFIWLWCGPPRYILPLAMTMTDGRSESNYPRQCIGDRWAETVYPILSLGS